MMNRALTIIHVSVLNAEIAVQILKKKVAVLRTAIMEKDMQML